MKNIIQLIFAFIFIIPQLSTAQNWVFQPNESQLAWTGKAAFSTYSLSGTIQLKNSSITVENQQVQSGSFVFDMKSMDGESKDLIKHLKSKDFFEVKKYKTATFKINTIKISKENQWIAEGDLTIKNKTKAIAFLITQNVVGNQLMVKGKAIINRTEFGITFNSPNYFEKLKDQAIADDFELTFDLVFLKAK